MKNRIVSRNKEEFDLVLIVLENEGWRWYSGDLPTELGDGYWNTGKDSITLNSNKKITLASLPSSSYNNIEAQTFLRSYLETPNLEVFIPIPKEEEPKGKMMDVLEFVHTIDPNFLGKWNMYEQVMKGDPQDLVGKFIHVLPESKAPFIPKGKYEIMGVHNNQLVTDRGYTLKYSNLYENAVLSEYYNEIKKI